MLHRPFSLVRDAPTGARVGALTGRISWALRLLDHGYAATDAGRRAVPSAGELYPYDRYLVVVDRHRTRVCHVDLDRRVCARVHAGGPVVPLAAAAVPPNSLRGRHG